MTALTSATFPLFERLVRRPLLVLDLEYCLDADGEHIISVGIVPVLRGKREASFYREMNPGVPIDPQTAAVHGFTDETVKGKRRFGYYAPAILAQLAQPDAILVTHTAVDVRVLRLELERLGPDAPAGLAQLPELPLLDTSTLGRMLGYPGIGARNIVSLATLCGVTGTNRGADHHARDDASATAAALIQLLVHAANTGRWADIDEVLDAHDRGTTHAPRGGVYVRHRDDSIPIPTEHLATHTAPLTHAGTAEEVTAWLDRAQECIRLACPYLADEAALATAENGPALLDGLTSLISSCGTPGQSGTLAGALAALLPPAPQSVNDDFDTEPVTSSALPHTRAVRWWVKNRPLLAAQPRCGKAMAERCPDCRDRRGCPLDLLHQRVAYIAVRGERGVLDRTRIKEHLFDSSGSRLASWNTRSPEVAAWAAWVACHYLDSRTRGSSLAGMRHAMALGLHKVEPRLALLVCEAGLLEADGDDSQDLARHVLARRTSDHGYIELAAWLTWHQQSVVRSKPKPPRQIRHPRLARPAGRTNPNPYLP